MKKVVITRLLILGYVLGIIVLGANHGLLVGLAFLLYPLLFMLAKSFIIKLDNDYRLKVNFYITYVIFRVISLSLVFAWIRDLYVPDPNNVSTLGPLVSFDHFHNLDVSQFQLAFNVLLLTFLPSVLIEGALLVFPSFDGEMYLTNMKSTSILSFVLLGQFIIYNILFYIHYFIVFILIQL